MDVLEQQAKRQASLKQACVNHTETHRVVPEREILQKHLVYYKEQDLAVCLVFKAGSKAIRILADAMNHNDTFSSALENPWKVALKRMKFTGARSISAFNIEFANTLKVLFVREPYNRFYSAYLDKLFFPRDYYWRVLGKHIINKHRDDATAHARSCGQDVTFSETVDYMIAAMNSHHVDEHFFPINEACQPCQIHYDIIGKVETSGDDLQLMWTSLTEAGVLDIDLSSVAISSSLELDLKAEELFEAKSKLLKCMGFYDLLTRTWQTLQNTGDIGCNVTMPIKESGVDELSLDSFKRILQQARQQSGSKEFRSQCKRQALTKAYSTVPMAKLRALQQILKPDFQLFGYDEEPSYIFNRAE